MQGRTSSFDGMIGSLAIFTCVADLLDTSKFQQEIQTKPSRAVEMLHCAEPVTTHHSLLDTHIHFCPAHRWIIFYLFSFCLCIRTAIFHNIPLSKCLFLQHLEFLCQFLVFCPIWSNITRFSQSNLSRWWISVPPLLVSLKVGLYHLTRV